MLILCFFFSSRRRHTICAFVTGVQTCALPISGAEFIGRSIRELEYARQVEAVIAGLWRRDGEIATRLSDARLREGDLLVLWGKPEDFADLAAHHGFLMLVPFAGEAKRRVRPPPALGLPGAAVPAVGPGGPP